MTGSLPLQDKCKHDFWTDDENQERCIHCGIRQIDIR